MAEELKYQSEHTGQQMDQAIDNYVAMTQAVQTAENSATAASASATAAAKSAADAQAVTQGQKGYFETDTALKAAHPTGQVGWWAIVGNTDTIWVWDDTTSTWLNSGNQTDLSNYYTKTQADAEFPAGTIVLESEDPTLVPLNADTLGGQASSYYGRATDIGDVSNLTTTAKTVVPAVNELNQNLEWKHGSAIICGTVSLPDEWTEALCYFHKNDFSSGTLQVHIMRSLTIAGGGREFDGGYYINGANYGGARCFAGQDIVSFTLFYINGEDASQNSTMDVYYR